MWNTWQLKRIYVCMFSINLFFRGAPLPKKLPRPTAPASKCTKMHSRRNAPAGRRHREEPEDGHISLSRLDYKTGHTAEAQAQAPVPKTHWWCCWWRGAPLHSSAENGKRATQDTGPDQEAGAPHSKKQDTRNRCYCEHFIYSLDRNEFTICGASVQGTKRGIEVLQRVWLNSGTCRLLALEIKYFANSICSNKEIYYFLECIPGTDTKTEEDGDVPTQCKNLSSKYKRNVWHGTRPGPFRSVPPLLALFYSHFIIIFTRPKSTPSQPIRTRQTHANRCSVTYVAQSDYFH